ncbi:MAG: 6-phosphofructokinase [Clostridia bacterium]|nr:6-phosphofructokinase [Clostridia bacterium]
MKRIAVLASGGDCQGMNAVVVDLVRRAQLEGIEVIGVKKGYKGLINKEYVVLTPEMFIENDVENRGGCFLKASRCPELQTPEGELKACEFLNEMNI